MNMGSSLDDIRAAVEAGNHFRLRVENEENIGTVHCVPDGNQFLPRHLWKWIVINPQAGLDTEDYQTVHLYYNEQEMMNDLAKRFAYERFWVA